MFSFYQIKRAIYKKLLLNIYEQSEELTYYLSDTVFLDTVMGILSASKYTGKWRLRARHSVCEALSAVSLFLNKPEHFKRVLAAMAYCIEDPVDTACASMFVERFSQFVRQAKILHIEDECRSMFLRIMGNKLVCRFHSIPYAYAITDYALRAFDGLDTEDKKIVIDVLRDATTSRKAKTDLDLRVIIGLLEGPVSGLVDYLEFNYSTLSPMFAYSALSAALEKLDVEDNLENSTELTRSAVQTLMKVACLCPTSNIQVLLRLANDEERRNLLLALSCRSLDVGELAALHKPRSYTTTVFKPDFNARILARISGAQ